MRTFYLKAIKGIQLICRSAWLLCYFSSYLTASYVPKPKLCMRELLGICFVNAVTNAPHPILRVSLLNIGIKLCRFVRRFNPGVNYFTLLHLN